MREQAGETAAAVLADVVWVDAQTFLAALPDDRDGGGASEDARRRAAAPTFDITSLGDIGVNDQYQLGVQVAGHVGCGWIAEWLRAKQVGDG